jgi:phage/plasmid primase-like uncharacterized protein
LLGQPTSEGFPHWRWGRRGSLSIRIDTGKWSDFSTGEWGSIEDLVMRERGLDRKEARAWLNDAGHVPPTPEQAAQAQQIQSKTRERLERRARTSATALLAEGARIRAKWPTLVKCHAYLKSKGLDHIEPPEGLGVISKSELRGETKPFGGKPEGHALILPIGNKDGVHSVQFIDRAGVKRFLIGGRVRGCHYLIGNGGDFSTVAFAEGLATAMSVHEATRLPVAVCFSAGNMRNVAFDFAARGSRIVICGDDDWSKPAEKNAGRTTAERAVNELRPQYPDSGAALAFPDFGAAERTIKDTDFNDMHRIVGVDAVRETITKALAKALDLPPLTFAEWMGRNLPDPDYISGSWLTTTSRVALIAPTGKGKTNLAMQLGYNISLGKDFLHWSGRRKCRVLYIDGEMSRRLLRDRLRDCAKRADGEVSDTFFALSHEDVENWKPLNTPEGQVFLKKFIERLGGVDLIIFDSIMCLLVGSMREEEPWAQTMPLVLALTKMNVAQIWVHHTGHDETKGYGDKTREWQLDTVIFLTPEKRVDTDVSFILEFRKARERRPETREDFRDAKIALVNDGWIYDEGPVKAKVKPIPPTAQRFLDALNNTLAGDGDSRQVRVIHGRRSASTDAWQMECVKLGLIDTKTKPNSARAMLAHYRRRLVSAYRVTCDGDWSWPIDYGPPSRGLTKSVDPTKSDDTSDPAVKIRIVRDCPPDTTCLHCHQTGDVKQIVNADIPGCKSETLHERCAVVWWRVP